MNERQKKRVWDKLNELESAIFKANEQLFDIKDKIKRNEKDINYSNVRRLKTTLESTLLELENLGA